VHRLLTEPPNPKRPASHRLQDAQEVREYRPAAASASERGGGPGGPGGGVDRHGPNLNASTTWAWSGCHLEYNNLTYVRHTTAVALVDPKGHTYPAVQFPLHSIEYGVGADP
jgi:hypothetical protein